LIMSKILKVLYILVSILFFYILYSCMSMNIDETGGLGRPYYDVFQLTLLDGQGYDYVINEIVEQDRSVFYFLDEKIFAPMGIAHIGQVKKRLSSITDIPFRNEEYTSSGMEPEENCVYSIRYFHNDKTNVLLVRVEKLSEKYVKLTVYMPENDG
jgi:hypothetical protein